MIKKIIASGLVFALCLLTLTSCESKKWIIKYDGKEISSDIYAYYVYGACEMLNYYELIDITKPFDEQTVTDTESEEKAEVPADKYINDYAIDQILFLCELEKRFKEAGLELDESTVSSIETGANTEFKSYEKFFEDNGITVDTVKKASNSGEFGTMREQLFKHLYGKGGPREVTEEQLTAFYQDRYVSYSYIYKMLVDSDGVVLEDDGKAVIRTELEDIKSKIVSGEKDIDDYAKEFANAYAEDKKCGKNGVVSTTSQKSDTALMQELSKMENGEVRYVELNNYAFLLKKHDIMDGNYFENEDNRYNLLVSMKFDEFIKEITDASKSASYTVNKKAYKAYGINKLNLDNLEVTPAI